MRNGLVRLLAIFALVFVGALGWSPSALAQVSGSDADIVQDGDNEGDADQDGGGQSGDGAAGSQITGIVSEPGSTTSVRKSNTSEDSEATSGDVDTFSRQSADVGPRVEDDETCPSSDAADELAACVVQDGDNELETTQTTTGTSGDALAGSQVTGVVNGGDTVAVDLENVSEDAEGTSGDADAFNDLFTSVGPIVGDAVTIEGPGAAAIEGPLEARVVQDGDNEVAADQAAAAASGDAVAGSQVAGVVTTGSGNAAITASQSSEDAEATTGDALAENSPAGGSAVVVRAGPIAGSAVDIAPLSITGPITEAGVVQDGDNEVDAAQTAAATTGDAVAGGQVVGVVSAGDVDLALDNTSEDDEATSGNTTADNDFDVINAGDIHTADGGDDIDIGEAASITDVVTLDQGVVHEGDNEVSLTHDATAASGDAVAGGQIAGGVVGAGGSFAADATNVSEDNESTSGDADATNRTQVLNAGDLGSEDDIDVGAASISGVTDAGVIHEGDNTAEVSASSDAVSGDAVSGASIWGVVGSGDVSVTTSNTAEDNEATSGDANAEVDAQDVVSAGDAFTDDNTIEFDSITDSTTDDGGLAHEGDNDVTLDESTAAGSGDAVAGAQVAGVVTAAGGSAALDLTNASEDGEATSGDADAFSESIEAAVAGDLAADENVWINSITNLGGTAGIVHEGDNEVALDTDASATTGDAVAGGQVAGAVGAGDMAIALDNTSDDAEATSGDAFGEIFNADAFAGNAFGQNDDVDISSIENVFVAEGAIVHDGDNTVDASRSAAGASGDAVAGGQVAGVVSSAGADIAIDGTNVSEDAEAESGFAAGDVDLEALVAGNLSADNEVEIDAIDGVDSGLGAGIVQDGDNDVEVTADGTGTSGDAVAGGQVFGIVGAGDADVVADNTSEDAEATSGSGENEIDTNAIVAGNITADLDEIDVASISNVDLDEEGIAHDGDNEASFDLASSGASGDAVAGGQIVGGVIGAGGSFAADLTNASEDDEAVSGDAFAETFVRGAVAGNLSASDEVFIGSIENIQDGAIIHEGDNEIDAAQSAAAATGDAVAGGQVVGAVGAGDASVTLDNASEDSEATSGDADTFVDNDDAILAGNAFSENDDVELDSIEDITDVSDGGIVHDGDNEIDVALEAGSASGDAVAGGQVAGVVTAAGGSVAIDGTNASEDAEAESGFAVAETHIDVVAAGNLAAAGDGVELNSITNVGGSASVIHEGDNELSADLEAGSASGDAVAGGQVFGVVAAGDVSIVADSSAEDAEATSGVADAFSELDTGAAGNLVGYEDGSDVSVSAIEGPLGTENQSVVQSGDNSADFGISTAAASGDAVAGGQIAGVVSGAGGSVAIDATSDSEDDEATSGDATAFGRVDAGVAGNIVADDTIFVSAIDADITTGSIVQDGDNDLAIGSDAAAATGDAVAGGSVIGVVGSGDADIVTSNTSEDSEATSGDADAFNDVFAAVAGNVVATNGDVDLTAIDGTITGVEVVHEGDNDLSIGQTAAAASGDAVAGGQIAGAVVGSGGSLSIDATNASEDAESTSGDALADNNISSAAVGGIFAAGDVFTTAIDADITGGAIVHDGDNDGSIDQSLDVASGDAVAGSQVTGAVVTGGTAEVVQDNTSEDDESTTGDATGTKFLDSFLIGPIDGSIVAEGGVA